MLIYLGIVFLSYLYGSKYLENFSRESYSIQGIEGIFGVDEKSISVHKNYHVSLSSGLHLRFEIIVGQQSTSITVKKKSFLVPRLLKLGPGYPSSIAGDGPRREDRESKSTDESPTSDSKSGSSDYRPPTPPKPRGMSKRNYKNMVRKHRKKYPTRKPKDRANGCQNDQSVRLKMKEQKQTETPTSCNPNFSNNDSHPPTPPMS